MADFLSNYANTSVAFGAGRRHKKEEVYGNVYHYQQYFSKTLEFPDYTTLKSSIIL